MVKSGFISAIASLGLLLATGPVAAADSSAPPHQLTIAITDSGFDQPSYTVGTSSTSPSDVALVTIVNRGTNVHTATRVPGSPALKVGFGTINFFAGQTTNLVDFDTGGIAPGQSVQYGVPYAGTYEFTSATDCLNGNKTPRFNCTPVTMQAVDSGAAPAKAAGTAIDQSSLTCAKVLQLPGTPDLCLSQSRQTGDALGSPAAGVGDTTVVVDDEGGFHPSVVYLKAGSTITWVNNGQQPHDVAQATGFGAPDGFHALDSGLLRHGDSYSYTYACPPGPTSANTGLQLGGCTDLVGPMMYWSNVGTDLIPPSADGFGTTTTERNTNSSLYIGSIYLVP